MRGSPLAFSNYFKHWVYVLTVFALKLSKRTVGLYVAKSAYFISNRVANEWNILGDGIIKANLLSGFIRKLDRFHLFRQ